MNRTVLPASSLEAAGKREIGVCSITPSSTMSSNCASNVLPNTILCGRFLLWFPRQNRAQSLRSQKNCIDVSASNGCTSFFLVYLIAWSCFNLLISMRTSFTTWLTLLPCRTSAFFGSSTCTPAPLSAEARTNRASKLCATHSQAESVKIVARHLFGSSLF